MARQKATILAPRTMQGYKAGFVTRLLAFVIDILIVSAMTLTVTSIVSIILDFIGIGGFVELDGKPFATATGIFIALLVISINFSLFVGYPVLFWVLAGQTLGKRFMGLRVISMHGDHITLKQALKRFVGYWLSALPLFLGYWWVLIDDDRQTWHDKFAKTYVVYDWDARHNEDFIRLLQERGEKRAERNRLVGKRLQRQKKSLPSGTEE